MHLIVTSYMVSFRLGYEATRTRVCKNRPYPSPFGDVCCLGFSTLGFIALRRNNVRVNVGTHVPRDSSKNKQLFLLQRLYFLLLVTLLLELCGSSSYIFGQAFQLVCCYNSVCDDCAVFRRGECLIWHCGFKVYDFLYSWSELKFDLVVAFVLPCLFLQPICTRYTGCRFQP